MASLFIDHSIEEILTGSYLPGDTITFDANTIQAQLKAYHRTSNQVALLTKQNADLQHKLELTKLLIETVQTKHKHYIVRTLDVVPIFNESC